MPEPDSTLEKKESQEEKIKKILKAPNNEKSKKTSSSIEESILDRIKK